MSKVIQQQKQYKILLIGECCQDVYVYGDVNRLNPEAPVPVLKKTNKIKKEGMAGNVFNNIKSLGKNISDIVAFFNDPKLIKKIRFIDKKSNYQLLRYDIENILTPLRFIEIPKESFDAIIISDYNKGYLTDELIKEITSFYKNTKIFVDTKRSNLSIFKNCVIKINNAENKKCYNVPESADVIVTLGAEGCTFKGKSYKTKKVDVHDVCGAGDVFLSSMVIGWLETKNMQKAIEIANQCASISVTKHGCYTVKRKEYENICL